MLTRSLMGIFIAGLAAFAQSPTTVAISGSVVDAAGAPVAGTKVSYNNSPVTVRDRIGHMKIVGAMVNSSIVTGSDGSFSITGLPAGVYWLCAQGVVATQIPSCDWGFGSTKIDLTTETSATNTKLQLHSGVTVTFQVNDPRGQIKDFPTNVAVPAAPGNFRIFVVDGTWLKPAMPVSSSGGVHQYSVTVPTSRAVRLLLDTKLNVMNQAATAVTAGKLNDTISVSSQPTTYRLTVQ
jgi:hypothetical protein